ncbi:MAG: cytochrome c biogenesis protein CcsA [Planctomycetes bacterium]|nr:cytochrome c biogenesis protein CcsA [Planctomycetota bacterium]
MTVLSPLASLRLTVVLFAFSIVLVLAGTLAQIDYDIWHVIGEYFRTWIAWIELKVFFPRAWSIPGTVPFPGGWMLGAALGLNLLAAHSVRFKVSGAGRSLQMGVALIAAGIALTYFVVQSGLGGSLESELSPEFCNGLWHGLRAAIGGGTLSLGYLLALSFSKQRHSPAAWLWWMGATTCALLAGLTLWLFLNPEVRLDPSGLRIMWHLIKSGAAGVVLLTGCYFVFGRRAGIVLLHGGIALIMFSELFTGLAAEEANMQIVKGQTVNYAEDNRSLELAVVDKSDDKQDAITTVPGTLLVDAWKSKKKVQDDALPFAIRVVDYLQNSRTRLAQPGEKSPATKGAGTLHIAIPQRTGTGVGKQQQVDVPSVYLELLSDGTSLGTYLFSPLLSREIVQVDGKLYELSFRFKRVYKPYSLTLREFHHDLYVGTNTPKNFSSEVQLVDAAHNVNRPVKIWMNNPLRYGGDTIYQSSFDPNNPNLTILQVVTNAGWMIPYVACMLVATGMLAHFGIVFFRFAQRQTAPTTYVQSLSFGQLRANWRSPSVWVPALILFVFAGWVIGKARIPKLPAAEMQVHQFGALPIAYNGRVKPFDTMARNTLTILSGHGKIDDEAKTPAITWLLDLIAGSPASNKHRMIRIDNLEVLDALGLPRRDGFRYSRAEVLEHRELCIEQAILASEVPQDERTLVQQKFKELGDKIILMQVLQASFMSPAIDTKSMETLKEGFQIVAQQIQRLNQSGPRAIPPTDAESGQWRTMLEAELHLILQRVQKMEIDEATVAMRTLLDAYRSGDVPKFNGELIAYRKIVEKRSAADIEHAAELLAAGQLGERKESERLRLARVQFEAFFNHFNPFVLAMALYLVAFVLAAGAWLGWTATLNRSANWLLCFTFVLHTFALVARIYISGRPPVTNLYSSAVFIGWGAVLFALVSERIYRFGIGNLLAAVVGFPTLFIAYNLAGDGDTFSVLQAVLDTQFWLATHVVCITLGYSTTLLAGALGAAYLLMTRFTKRLDELQQKQLIRMAYGTICFATFFSFVGTVLGGLWADDSWGRFWGWDPKENGALMIVLWNVLVLHARWGGMIRQTGIAVLATFGCVITAWSWFGVNQMGVGLHAYGFRAGMAFWLIVFAVSQILIMMLGCLPGSDSRRPPSNDTLTSSTSH